MEPSVFGYLLSTLLYLTSGALHFCKANFRLFAHANRPFAINNVDFTKFRRRYAVGHLLVLFVDSLQAPYLYLLFKNYNYDESQIALFYSVGLAANVLASILVYHRVQFWERRLVCFLHCSLVSISCLLKAFAPISWSLFPLVVSRLMDGVSTTLLFTPFQDWYLHEHLHRYDFPKEWIPVSFQFVSMRSSLLAIVSGYLVEMLLHMSNITFPYLLCIPLLLVASFWIYYKWPSNQLDPTNVSKVSVRQELLKARQIIFRRPNVIVLSIIQALYESSLCIFVFLWVPLFVQMKVHMTSTIGYGAIYACLMGGTLLGIVAYRKMTIYLTITHLLVTSSTLSFFGLSLATMVTYPGTETSTTCNLLLLAFTVYQIGAGIYFPVMQRLQKDVLPADSRPFIVSLFRIPLNAIAIGALMFLNSHQFYGNWLLLCFCSVSSLTCLFLSLLLARIIRRADVDYFMLQLKDDQQMEV